MTAKEREERREINLLVKGVSPTAKIPRRFELWPPALIIAWLRQHQKRKPKSKKLTGF